MYKALPIIYNGALWTALITFVKELHQKYLTYNSGIIVSFNSEMMTQLYLLWNQQKTILCTAAARQNTTEKKISQMGRIKKANYKTKLSNPKLRWPRKI